MKFLKTFCFIILFYAVLGHGVQAGSVMQHPVKQVSVHDKEPKHKERKKVIIAISREVGFVLLTILEIVIESYEYNPGCSRHH